MIMEEKLIPLQIPSSSHAVLFYETEEEMYGRILPFIKEGLDNSEAVIYILDEDDIRYQREFENYGIDVKAPKGLTVVHAEDWYLERGSLYSEKVLKKWMDAVYHAKKLGFRELRSTSGYTYFFKNRIVDPWISHEQSLPGYFPFPMRAICRYRVNDLLSYDMGRLLPELLKIHSHVITPNLIEEIDFPSFYLESINEVLNSIFGEAIRKILLSQIESKCALPRSEIPMKLPEFTRALGKLLGTGGKVVERAILTHLYKKIGLRYYLGEKRSD